MNSILNEKSLRPMILRDLIYPIISVDEYTPKLDPNNIVVLFQVLDNFDAAYDLSSFIERSPVNVLDTEAVEIPNLDGRYNVFVEFERNGEFIKKFTDLITDIENLCPNPGWKLQIYRINDPIDIDPDLMQQDLLLNTVDELNEFFDYAPVKLSFLYENKKLQGLQLNSVYGIKLNYEYTSSLIEESKLEKLLSENEYKLDNTKLSSVLGENEYTVLRLTESNSYIIGRNGKFLILR